MNNEKIAEAVREAERFLAKHKAFEAAIPKGVGSGYYMWGTKESGALRRASMDLTRALAEMRKP